MLGPCVREVEEGALPSLAHPHICLVQCQGGLLLEPPAIFTELSAFCRKLSPISSPAVSLAQEPQSGATAGSSPAMPRVAEQLPHSFAQRSALPCDGTHSSFYGVLEW